VTETPTDAGQASVVTPVADASTSFDSVLVIATAGQCEPLSEVAAGTFVPAPGPPPGETIDTEVAAEVASISGAWVGYATAPSSWAETSWELTLSFTADSRLGGHFTANTPTDDPAFYYGSNDSQCDPLRQWAISTLGADGFAGSIDIPFRHESSACSLPAWQGELARIVTDLAATRLELDFSTSDGHGPVHYNLFRVCPIR